MAESQPNGDPAWWRRHRLALTLLGLIVLLAYAVLAATVLPPWIVSVSAGKADENHRLDAIVNTRGALLGLLGPVVVAIGAVAALLNYRETSAQNRRTLDVTRRGQLTERFTNAIDQLGQTAEDKLDIRLGGIYALEQIAKESAELHGPVMEILTAFLREHSRQPRKTPTARPEDEERAADEVDHGPTNEAATEEATLLLRADFQAIATVLGRRQVSHDPDGFRLDLGGLALGGVNLAYAQLQGATFWNAQLQNASFLHAQLQDADFQDAQLQGARFWDAQLQDASFLRAQLQGASFFLAHVEGANFENADLDRANLRAPGTDLLDFRGMTWEQFRDVNLETLGLTWEQLGKARNVDKAILPDYLTKAREFQP